MDFFACHRLSLSWLGWAVKRDGQRVCRQAPQNLTLWRARLGL
ncbi:hypothetical protein HMPREF9080_02009 [Cardiobacterium valvarum F0432]|uniref:Uncharacterized protein n=1 Tax=Cardiobacterium valvarum F0432 TaxID=797473 RepID=G9ZGP4_9GAMM|nr:hypothetical protein HMPREF9080_02009 [Cardiobacterium valvarum F0432]